MPKNSACNASILPKKGGWIAAVVGGGGFWIFARSNALFVLASSCLFGASALAHLPGRQYVDGKATRWLTLFGKTAVIYSPIEVGSTYESRTG